MISLKIYKRQIISIHHQRQHTTRKHNKTLKIVTSGTLALAQENLKIFLFFTKINQQHNPPFLAGQSANRLFSEPQFLFQTNE